MSHRSIAAAVFMAVLFLGTARQADAQVYLQTGSVTPYSYTTYYPSYGTVLPYSNYVYPAARFQTYSYPMSTWGGGSRLPYMYGNTWSGNTWSGNTWSRNTWTGNAWNSNYGYRSNYGWNSGGRGRGWRR